MKEYLKPEAEYISLVATEEITTGDDDDFVDGEIGVESSVFWFLTKTKKHPSGCFFCCALFLF